MLVLCADMESAIPVQPKVRSPAVSAASKEEPKRTPAPVEESPDVESHSEVKTINVDMSSSDKKVPALPDVVEGTMESKILKEKTPEATPVVKESQEKMPVVGEQGEIFCSCLFPSNHSCDAPSLPIQFLENYNVLFSFKHLVCNF